MKYPVARFKSLKEALKELEPFIRNGEHLQTGKPFARFGGLRSREILANWLLCVALNFTQNEEDRLTFSSDPIGGDAIIYDTATEMTWPTEHILVPRTRGGEADDVAALILKAVARKQSKGGAAYASGKILVVFLNAAGGEWYPNTVAKQLPETLYFREVWVVGLQSVTAGEYVYAATLLDLSDGNAPTWRVRIGKDFYAWEVEPIQ
jgi:hypothetical protein